VQVLDDGPGLALDEAALLIAAHASPEVDVDGRLAQLDRLADQVSDRTRHGVLRLLFRELGFVGNSSDYYDPANSYLDAVLDRRVGNPITLSVLTLSVARRCGSDLDPVGMPGHFLLRDRGNPELFIDAFHGGAELDVDGCRALFGRLGGRAATFTPDLLTPIAAPLVLARMLNNLIASHRRLNDRDALAWSARLRSHITTAPAPGLDEIADELGHAGRWDVAGAILHNLAQGDIAAEARKALEQRSLSWYARLN